MSITCLDGYDFLLDAIVMMMLRGGSAREEQSGDHDTRRDNERTDEVSGGNV